MSEKEPSYEDLIKNICAIIQERDKDIFETEVKIKYYKDAIEVAERESTELEKDRKRTADEDKEVDKQLERLEFIEKSVKESQEIATESLIRYQTFEKMIAKEVDAKEQDTKRIDEEFRTIYDETKTNLRDHHPHAKELEEARVKFLKVDIKRRQLEVKIRNKKRMFAQRADIQKKIFYNYFVQMAEGYLTERNMAELQKLKMRELEAIKKLYVLQEEAKLRQKLGTPKDKVMNVANICFGSQECHPEKSDKNSEPIQNFPQSLGKQLNMFQQDEPQRQETPQKIKIIDDKVLVPAFVAPQFPVSEKRKASVDLSKNWQKIIKRSNSKELCQSIRSPIQSQASQQSQQSQVCDELVTPEPASENKLVETSMQNISQTPFQEPPKTPLIENMETVTHEESLIIPPAQEKVPIQYKLLESFNPSPEMTLMSDKTQPCPSTYKRLSQQPVNSIMKPRSILSAVENKNVNQGTAQKAAFGEASKSVRFLEPSHQPRANKGIFSQSMFGNPFDSLFGRAAAQEIQDGNQQQEHNVNNNSFNISLTESSGATANIGLGFETAGNQSDGASPEYTYTMEGEEDHQPFKAPEMPSFKPGSGGGFFSFGSKSMFPFK